MTKQKKTRKIYVAKHQIHELFKIIMQQSTENVNQNLLDTLHFIYENPPPHGVDVPLSMLSERDEKWNKHRNDTQDVSNVYAGTEFDKYYERMKECSTYLEFSIDNEKGLKLRRSFFCHVRNCPVCQWRKSLYWKAMMYKTYDKIKDDYKRHRWLFLTLTVQNCHITELRATIKKMYDAFKKLTKRKEFKSVVGYIKTTEVTRDKKRPYTHAHPHFHCMLLVKPEYFKTDYVKHANWLIAWQECLNVSYVPSLDIRAIYNKKQDDALRDVIAETLKYACKPSDMLFDKTYHALNWFLEYTRQIHKMRFVNSGGVLKNALKHEKDVTDDDMIHLSSDDKRDDDSQKKLLRFSYYSSKRSYIYNPYLKNS